MAPIISSSPDEVTYIWVMTDKVWFGFYRTKPHVLNEQKIYTLHHLNNQMITFLVGWSSADTPRFTDTILKESCNTDKAFLRCHVGWSEGIPVIIRQCWSSEHSSKSRFYDISYIVKLHYYTLHLIWYLLWYYWHIKLTRMLKYCVETRVNARMLYWEGTVRSRGSPTEYWEKILASWVDFLFEQANTMVPDGWMNEWKGQQIVKHDSGTVAFVNETPDGT
jgi:hypothetical protein